MLMQARISLCGTCVLHACACINLLHIRGACRYALEMRRIRGYMPDTFIATGIDRTTAQLQWVQFGQFKRVQPELWRQAEGVPLDARGQSSRGGAAYAVTVAIYAEVRNCALATVRCVSCCLLLWLCLHV